VKNEKNKNAPPKRKPQIPGLVKFGRKVAQILMSFPKKMGKE